jgi:diguanylate cyclase (GGDEF)-like protein
MPLKNDPVFGSALGRRLLGVLAGAAVLPLLLLALLAGAGMWSVLDRRHDAELAHLAALRAAATAERLAQAGELLQSRLEEFSSDLPLARSRLALLVDGESARFAGLARLDADGRQVDAVGRVPVAAEALAALEAAQRAALAAGRPLALAGTADAPVILLLPTGRASPRYAAAALTPGQFAAPLPADTAGTRYCLLAGRTPAGCAVAFPAAALQAVADGGAQRALRWETDGRTQRAAAAALPLDGQRGWTIVAMQPASETAAVLQNVGLAFLFALLATAVGVFLIASHQVRLIGAPIRELLRGTQRLAQRDFSTQVAVTRDDEFGRLAAAFNTMATRLALQFGTLQAMAKIDRAILNSVDLADVALNSIRCLRHIVTTDLISVGLIHPESPARLMIQTRRKGAQGIEKHELDWPEAAALCEGATPTLPAEYERHLERAAPTLRVLPIARGGNFWGVIVLGDHPQQALDADRASLLSGVVDRLAVALSTAARDWRLHVQAHYDPLTGLPNRAHLLTLLNQHIAMARRDGTRGAVLFLDLDRFKQTNDTLGHATGDALLRLAAERIRLTLRESDTVARIGGDEFTVVLPRIASSIDAGQVAGNLIAALGQPFEIDGQKLYAGGTVGIALYPEDGACADDLLKRADTAMYRAKELGRGRHAFFKPSMGLEVSARATLDRELRQALERRELVLHYQPQVDVATGEITSAEALLRWQHPTRGLLGPAEFIDFAEENGLIEDIGKWVLKSACEQHRRWEQQGLPVPRVAVNVSNRQLKQPGFLSAVDVALVKSGREPAHLEIEITESLLVDGGESTLRALAGLQQAGVTVAIDDFGTGYSSFAYLRTLPAALLKLDRSFVTDIASDPDAEVIAASMINMARTLRKVVVVEGVETQEQLALLTAQGAHRIQGFLVSRPLPAAQFEEFVREYESNRFACTPADDASRVREAV